MIRKVNNNCLNLHTFTTVYRIRRNLTPQVIPY